MEIETHIKEVADKLYYEKFPKHKGVVPSRFYHLIKKEDDKRIADGSNKSLYKWCKRVIFIANIRAILAKISVVFMYLLLSPGILLFAISKIIRFFAYLLMIDTYSARDEITEWEL